MISLGLMLSRGDRPRVRRALLEAMAVESNYRNVRYGDRDSLGVLQQRPSQGWGPGSETPAQDITQFLTRARRTNRGFQGTAGQLAQSVQRSAYPGRYDQRRAEVNRLLGGGAPAPLPRNFNPQARARPRPQLAPDAGTLAAGIIQSNNEIIGVPTSPLLVDALRQQPPALRPPVSRRTRELPGVTPGAKATPVGKKILATAHAQVGQPYVWGGESRREGGFDCSGLIYAAYLAQGIKIPRTTYEQVKVGKPVKWGRFRPGDLVFTNGGEHVVLYVGGGKVLAAPHRGELVQYQPLEGFRSSFYAARRYL